MMKHTAAKRKEKTRKIISPEVKNEGMKMHENKAPKKATEAKMPQIKAPPGSLEIASAAERVYGEDTVQRDTKPEHIIQRGMAENIIGREI